jgi:hypothetical protein
MKTANRGNRLLVLAGLAVFALACSSTTDPFGTGPGSAAVQGLVSTSAGTPVTATSVRVVCGDSPAVIAQTDALGRYLTNLQASTHAMNAGRGRVSCRFTEPADGVERVQRDTMLGFAQGPVMVALQTVNLQEH